MKSKQQKLSDSKNVSDLIAHLGLLRTTTAAFLDTEKAFNNAWHNGLRYKVFQLDLPIKMTRWLSDFPVGHVIQVSVKWFLVQLNKPQSRGSTGFSPESITFLIYVSDLPTPHHKQSSLSQFADYTAQWAFSLNVRFAAKCLQQDLLNMAMWCAKWRIKLHPEKIKVIIQVHAFQKNRT